MTRTRGSDIYAALVVEYLEQDGTTTSTMMGFPCLRRDGTFFASLEPRTESLILKLPAQRVTELIDADAGEAFAPNGRIFREWITIDAAAKRNWRALTEEAWQFAATAS